MQYIIYSLAVFFLSICPILLFYFFREKPFIQKIIIIAIRFFLGVILFGAGLVRFIPDAAIGIIGPPWLISELSKYGLGLYAVFISLSEMLIGYLLMTNRFATIGAIMCVPMFVNILAVVVSLKWQGTPFVVFSLLVLNFLLLVYDWHKIKFIFIEDASVPSLKPQSVKRSDIKMDIRLALLFVYFMITVAVSYFDTSFASIMSWIGYILLFGLLLYSIMQAKRKT